MSDHVHVFVMADVFIERCGSCLALYDGDADLCTIPGCGYVRCPDCHEKETTHAQVQQG